MPQDLESKPAAPQVSATDRRSGGKESKDARADRDLAGRGEQVWRYQQRLEQQQSLSNSAVAAGGPQPSGAVTLGGRISEPAGMAFGQPDLNFKSDSKVAAGGFGGGLAEPQIVGLVPTIQDQTAVLSDVSSLVPTQTVPAQAGYLVSLDTDFPVRGDEYLFSTPRGDIELTANSVSKRTIERSVTTIVLALAILLTWIVSRRVIQLWQKGSFRIAVAVMMALIALAMLINGYTPLYAIAFLVLAVMSFTRSR